MKPVKNCKWTVNTHNFSVVRLLILSSADDLDLLKHPRVYALADEFFIDGLKDLAFKKLQSMLNELWISDTFVDCIEEVYVTTYHNSDRMRRLVVQVARQNLQKLWIKNRFQELVRENGDFAVDLIEKLSRSIC